MEKLRNRFGWTKKKQESFCKDVKKLAETLTDEEKQKIRAGDLRMVRFHPDGQLRKW